MLLNAHLQTEVVDGIEEEYNREKFGSVNNNNNNNITCHKVIRRSIPAEDFIVL